MKNILVTGCAGDIGFSIGKILKQSSFYNEIIGCDIYDNHAGRLFFDKCLIVPKVDNLNYFSELSKIVEKNKIILIIPTSEPEIRFFYKNKIAKIGSAHILICNQKSLDMGLDKYKTYEFLKLNALPYPWTKKVSDGEPLEIPCICKHPTSCGSKDVAIITERNYFDYSKKTDYLWQELLLPSDEEYTCGLFRSKNKEVRSIVFKRVLKGGLTNSGELIENNAINNLLYQVAELIDLNGSINIQLRLTANGPKIFEINPRFSSTVRFRDMLGFKDVIWSIMDYHCEEISDYIPPIPPVQIYRVYDEAIFYTN